LENINIDIDIEKKNFENIYMEILRNIDIDMEILRNIDIAMEILRNIDIDKILNQLEFGLSKSP